MQPRLPRIVGILVSLALLAWVNREAPRLVPAVLTLLVLYAALTNLGPAESLVSRGSASLARLFHPVVQSTKGH